jgi:hypothetical protein
MPEAPRKRLPAFAIPGISEGGKQNFAAFGREGSKLTLSTINHPKGSLTVKRLPWPKTLSITLAHDSMGCRAPVMLESVLFEVESLSSLQVQLLRTSSPWFDRT